MASSSSQFAYQQCIHPDCAATYGIEEVRVACDKCGSLLDVAYDWNQVRPPKSLEFFESQWSNRHLPLRYSGVWRFHELLPFAPRGSSGDRWRRPDLVAAGRRGGAIMSGWIRVVCTCSTKE